MNNITAYEIAMDDLAKFRKLGYTPEQLKDIVSERNSLRKQNKEISEERDKYAVRLTHLCRSSYIASFDEIIPETGRYRRDIDDAVGPDKYEELGYTPEQLKEIIKELQKRKLNELYGSGTYGELKNKGILVVRCNSHTYRSRLFPREI